MWTALKKKQGFLKTYCFNIMITIIIISVCSRIHVQIKKK